MHGGINPLPAFQSRWSDFRRRVSRRKSTHFGERESLSETCSSKYKASRNWEKRHEAKNFRHRVGVSAFYKESSAGSVLRRNVPFQATAWSSRVSAQRKTVSFDVKLTFQLTTAGTSDVTPPLCSLCSIYSFHARTRN